MFSCEFCQDFKNIFFAEYLQTAASGAHVQSASCIFLTEHHFHLLPFVPKTMIQIETVICCKEYKQIKYLRFSGTYILKKLKRVKLISQ